MRSSCFPAVAAAAAVVLCFQGASDPARAQNQPAVELSGHVSSAEEGLMEGVLVTARKMGSTIAITVVSDQAGTYNFPNPRLEPGHYTLKIRAVGYDLEGTSEVDV